MALGPACVHSSQHLSPVLGLGSAGAGLDKQKGAVIIRRVTEQCNKLCAVGVYSQLLDSGNNIRIFWVKLIQLRQGFVFRLQRCQLPQCFFKRRLLLQRAAGFIRVIP